jgi:hypothetical protein
MFCEKITEQMIMQAEKKHAKVLADMASAEIFFCGMIGVGSDPTPGLLYTVLLY